MTDNERKEKRIRSLLEQLEPTAIDFLRTARLYGLSDMASITIDPRTGYIYGHLHESTIDLCRIAEDSEFTIRNLCRNDEEESDG